MEDLAYDCISWDCNHGEKLISIEQQGKGFVQKMTVDGLIG